MSSSPARTERIRLLIAGLVTAVLLVAAFAIDPVVHDWVRNERPEALRAIAKAVSLFGTGAFLLPVLLVIVARGWVLDDRESMRIAALAAVALILAGIASPTLKLVFSRYRPNESLAGAFRLFAFAESDASFPSGHSIAAFALAGVLASALPSRRWWIYGLAALIPVARVVGGRHFVSDTVAGIAVGLLTAWAAPRAVAWWRRRREATASAG